VEDIVGTSFFAFLFVAIVVTISGSVKSLSPEKGALRRGLGLSLISVALIGFGFANVYFVRISSRPVVEGNLWDIRRSIKNNSGARFMITDATGHAVLIRCKYSGPGLVEGERARVRYIAYNNKLLEMEMLDGPFQTWHFQESSGEGGWWTWAAIGLVCGLFAYRQIAKALVAQTV
jgi:hypothetical protein